MKYLICQSLDDDAVVFRAGPGVKNFVRERRRESCRERSMAGRRKHVFRKEKDGGEISTGRHPLTFQCNIQDPGNCYSNCVISDGPKVSDFIDLRIWKKKKVCCGTIFVNAEGEAILDPRFLTPCHGGGHASSQDPPPPNFSQTLMALETIVTEELEHVQGTNTDNQDAKVPDRKERKDSEKSCDSKVSSDQDEGFFDRSSSSPSFEDGLGPQAQAAASAGKLLQPTI